MKRVVDASSRNINEELGTALRASMIVI